MSFAKTRVIFDRKKVATATKTAPVIIEVYCNRERKFFSTGVELYKDQWKRETIVKRSDAFELMDRINSLKIRIDGYINDRIKADEEINLDTLRAWIDSNSSGNTASFLVFMSKRINERPMAMGTWRMHRSVWNTLSHWGQIVTFADVNKKNILLWDELSRKNSKSGKPIQNYHKVMKIYIRDAMRFGYIKENPYEDFQMKYDRTIKHSFLTKEELDKWKSIELADESLDKARDMFVFCCYTGLAFSDLRKFDMNDIVETKGVKRYRSKRVKTSEGFNITLLKPALEIIDKYGCVPTLDEHVYNRLLKVVAYMCGIRKKISSHCGRTTFASTVMLSNKVPLKIIAMAMGHATTKQTEEYAKLVQEDVDEEFDRLNSIV